jgi:hypothetical protein
MTTEYDAKIRKETARDMQRIFDLYLKNRNAELIKAVEKFKVIDGLDVIINKGDIVIFKKEWELLKGDKK